MPSKLFLITKNELETLYLKQNLSTDKVAKLFNCSHVTILNYLNRYNIPRRSKLGNRKPVSISKEILIDLYTNKKFSHRQIAQQFGYSRYGIQRWMKIYGIQSRNLSESNAKYPKYNFSNNLIEKAYLIGFRLGDLNVYKVHKLIQVRCSTTIKSQAILIENLFKKYGNVHIWKAKRGTFEIVVLLNDSFNFLLPKNDLIEEWILLNNETFFSFLAGYSDAEGSYYLRKPYLEFKVGWAVFEIQTYDKKIIESIAKNLVLFRIENTFSKSRAAGYIDKRGIKGNKDCWRIVVVKKQSLWNLIKLLEPYHKHENKLRDLKNVKNNLLLRNRLPYCKPIVL